MAVSEVNGLIGTHARSRVRTNRAHTDERAAHLPKLARYLIDTAIWIPATAIALLVLPMFVTKRTFGHDWTLHLWLVRQQQLNIERLGHPSLFVSTRHLGPLYPMFSFVGSGLYTVGAYLAIALGDRPILAYKLLYVAGFCLAFGGMSWLATQLGLRGWRAQMPGMVVVTGAYFITDFVGRGDFGEFMALCSIPFIIAAARAIVTTAKVRPAHVLALVVGAFVFTGSHNITLLWGTFFVVALAAVVLFSTGLHKPAVSGKQLVAASAAFALGVGLNAWYLVGDLAYGLNTAVSKLNVRHMPSMELSDPVLLLNPFRPANPYPPFWRDLRFALPWFFLAWAFLVVRRLWSTADGSERRLVVGFGAVIAAYVTLIVWRAPWKLAPHVLYNIQFTWRLHGYVLLGTALLVLLVVRWADHAVETMRRTIAGALIAIVAFNLGAAVWQVWRVRSEYVSGNREVVAGRHFADSVVAATDSEPLSWYPKAIYEDVALPLVATEPGRGLDVPASDVHHGSLRAVLPVPDGTAPFRTNLYEHPKLVRFGGIRIVGRTRGGTLVAVRAPGAARTGPITVSIEPVQTKLLGAGVLITLLSLALLVALLGWSVWAPIRRFSRDR